MKKYKVGVVGATGMVGQRLVSLLAGHPWFDLRLLAASRRNAGQEYGQAVAGRWVPDSELPDSIRALRVMDALEQKQIAREVDFIFCAVSLPKAETLRMEEAFAKLDVPVISNNSANRGTPDVPMVIPEINARHLEVIAAQRRRLGCENGFIVVKPNCSIQSYVPVLSPLLDFGLTAVSVCTFQAVSGAGRTLGGWPEIMDNVIPFIPGEEEKSEREPLKIWGSLHAAGDRIVDAPLPVISASCLRVPVSDGHLAAVSVKFMKKPGKEEILERWANWLPLPQQMNLPSAPKPFLVYTEEPDRPQPALDRGLGRGMAVTVGRLREDPLMDWRFVCLSHNTLRGAAGGSVLTAELLCAQETLKHRV